MLGWGASRIAWKTSDRVDRGNDGNTAPRGKRGGERTTYVGWVQRGAPVCAAFVSARRWDASASSRCAPEASSIEGASAKQARSGAIERESSARWCGHSYERAERAKGPSGIDRPAQRVEER